MDRRDDLGRARGLAESQHVGPALYLATVGKRVRRVTRFTIGVFTVTFAVGLVLTIGPGRLLIGWCRVLREQSGT